MALRRRSSEGKISLSANIGIERIIAFNDPVIPDAGSCTGNQKL